MLLWTVSCRTIAPCRSVLREHGVLGNADPTRCSHTLTLTLTLTRTLTLTLTVTLTLTLTLTLT